jgi:predicted ATPase/RsiW-degrading membrane proteinase PrsW (M82 family)
MAHHRWRTAMLAILDEPGFYLTFAVVQAVVLLLLIWGLDLYERQPLLLVMLMAFWGGTGAAVIALAGNRTVKGLLSGEAQTVFGDAISAPLVEEGAKGLALVAAIGPIRWLAKRFGVTIFEGLTAGIVYGAAVGIGFAFTEDFFYLLNRARTQGVEAGLNLFVYRRDFFGPAVLHHPLFTAAFGAGLGLATWTTRRWLKIVFPLAGLAIAITMHAANNGLVEAVLTLGYGINEAYAWTTGAAVPASVEDTGAAMESVLRLLDYIYITVFLAAAALWLRYQRSIIQSELADEAATGLVTAGELETITRPGLRTRRYWRLVRSGQLEQWRHLRRLHSALVRLALLKWRVERFGGDARSVQRARREIATLATFEPAAGNLPEPPTPLVGRERELAEAKELLRQRDTRLVTLIGPGGTGKTRLSIDVATELRDDFGSGAFFCPIATITDPEVAVSAIAKTLEVRERPGEPPLEPLKDHLRDKHMLLVLDNAEQVLGVAPALAELLSAAPRLKLLVTSREALRVRGEREYPVPPLGGDEAFSLFIDRARAADPGFAVTEASRPTIEWICRRLDGLPLAVELAAARMKLFTPGEIRERLEGSLLETTGEGARDALDHHQTLRAAIEWSYGMLEEDEATLFARLGIFAGGFELPAVETVCEGRPRLLESLLDKSLGRRDRQYEDRARFEMLETIREFALEKLDEAGERERLRRRHAEYYLGLAQEAEPELRGAHQLEWVRRLGREHENFRAALDWVRESGEGELGLRLCFALARFWEQLGTLGEARKWLEAALASDGAAPAPIRARGHSYLGRLALLQSDYAKARASLEQGLGLGRETADDEEVAACLVELGWIDLVAGDYQAGRERLEEGLRLSHELGDDQLAARALRTLARVRAEEGDPQGAKPLLEESLELRRRLEDQRGVATTLSAIGRIELLRGHLDEAQAALDESVAVSRALGDKLRIAEALYFLALVRLAQGSEPDAMTLAEERLTLCRELGDRLGIAECFDLSASRDARLLGAAQAIRDSLEAQMWPYEQARRKEVESLHRSQLGDGAYEAAVAEGAAMSIEEALESVRRREERPVGAPS